MPVNVMSVYIEYVSANFIYQKVCYYKPVLF